MYRTKTQSIFALAANSLVEDLQRYFVSKLNALAGANSSEKEFEPVEWFRDKGVHGGGVRFVAMNEQVFNRASVNVSQVHYDDKTKNLASATALSTIIHPHNPFAPSIHMHISWTEMRNGKGYWRMMADLNPTIENEDARQLFVNTLKKAAPKQYDLAAAQGDRYFYIPALERHRGVSHFYLEGYTSGDVQDDLNQASKLGMSVIDCYIDIFEQAIHNNPTPTEKDFEKQRTYHTLYLFQVLTLDRGTTSGLLVHDQNDVGIMGSLPAYIDKPLLTSWKERLVSPQNELLQNILNVLPDLKPCPIDNEAKLALANAVRQHYKDNPNALSMQAQGNVIPSTVDNHLS